MSEPVRQQLDPNALFVVACPVCQGHVAAAGGLCGRDACCPLCASLFRVPFPGCVEAAAVGPEQKPAGVAEDWEPVITQLTPPRATPEPSALPQESMLESLERPPAERGSPAESPVVPAAGIEHVGDPTESVPPAAPAAQPVEALSRSQEPEALVPLVGATPVDAGAEELVFTEPVRTVRQGDRVIEIRRLSPEERRSRRFRRNLMMIVVGISILLAIVLLAGF